MIRMKWMKKNETNENMKTNRIYENKTNIWKRKHRNVSEYLMLCCVVLYSMLTAKMQKLNIIASNNSRLNAKLFTFYWYQSVTQKKEREYVLTNKKATTQHKTKIIWNKKKFYFSLESRRECKKIIILFFFVGVVVKTAKMVITIREWEKTFLFYLKKKLRFDIRVS